MNCKFCGNFVPDGSDTCLVCGRRPTEDPIGKLLSENQPSSLAAASPSSSEASAESGKKGLVLPLLGVLAAAGAWIYTVLSGLWETVKQMINGIIGGVQSAANGGSYASGLGSADVIVLAALALITVVGIIGLVALIKKLRK